jgi:hypothetical protein
LIRPLDPQDLTVGKRIAFFLCERNKKMKTKTNVKAGTLYTACCTGKHFPTATITT